MIEYLDNGFILNPIIEELNSISFEIFFVKINERFIVLFQFIKNYLQIHIQKILFAYFPIVNLIISGNFFLYVFDNNLLYVPHIVLFSEIKKNMSFQT